MNDRSGKLLKAFIHLTRLIHREGHKHAHDMHDSRMHRGKAHLLAQISENIGAKQMELAEMMDMRPSSMTEMLVSLEQSGLIIRKQDENDQRVMRVYMTEEGTKALESFSSALSGMSQSLFGALTDEEQEQFLKLAEKIIDNFDDVKRPDDRCCSNRHRRPGRDFFHFRRHRDFDRL